MTNSIEQLRNEYRQTRTAISDNSDYSIAEVDALVADAMAVANEPATPENYVAYAKSVLDAIEQLAIADAMYEWQLIERQLQRN